MLRLQQIFDNNKLTQSIAAYKQNPKDAKALWALHYYYQYGWCTNIIDQERSLACLERAALEGHAGASYKLAEHFSQFRDQKSLSLVERYTNKTHIQFCKDKTNDCDDKPYYDQDSYIKKLEELDSQAPQTNIYNQA